MKKKPTKLKIKARSIPETKKFICPWRCNNFDGKARVA